MSKKKLLIVVGAGASVEFGMPSVSKIDSLFDTWSQSYCVLENDKTLYAHIRDSLNSYYNKNLKERLRCETNYEQVLHVMFQLSGCDNHPTENLR